MTDRPVSDPSETLELMTEYKLSPIPFGSGWVAIDGQNGRDLAFGDGGTVMLEYTAIGQGATIGDAVRACVARIKSNQ
jgi:hypothetical protein